MDFGDAGGGAPSVSMLTGNTAVRTPHTTVRFMARYPPLPSVARERYLFRAGSAGYTYPEILEVRKGSLRLLRPSGEGQRRQRVITTLIALAYIFGVGAVLGFAARWKFVSPVIAVAEIVLFFAGLLALEVVWDRWSLPLLAEAPAATIPLQFLSARSYRTFQEIRGSADGTALSVAVPGSHEKLEDALRFAGLANPLEAG